jgi:hypothetical protein
MRSAGAVRQRWSAENRNLRKRDAKAWRAARHRHRKPNAALNLALTRNVLLASIPFEERQPSARISEHYHRPRTTPLGASTAPVLFYEAASQTPWLFQDLHQTRKVVCPNGDAPQVLGGGPAGGAD